MQFHDAFVLKNYDLLVRSELICCSENLNDMLGELFVPRDMPEPPKQGFFQTLFNMGSATLDREELCKSSDRIYSKIDPRRIIILYFLYCL